MKEVFVSFARYNQEADQKIGGLLDKLSNEEREKERGSYYKSLSGLFRHVIGGTAYFLHLFKPALAGNAAAEKIIASVEGLECPEGALSEAQWKALAAVLKSVDQALVDLVSSLGAEDLKKPVSLEWYGGNPASVPLAFMLQQLVAHGTHHRGQISQILDELKIDNDYSGINAAFLPKL